MSIAFSMFNLDVIDSSLSLFSFCRNPLAMDIDFRLIELNLAGNALNSADIVPRDKGYTSVAVGSTQNKSFDFLGMLCGMWSFSFHG